MKHFITALLLLLQIIPAASWPNEFNETTDLQPGFSAGMAPEIEGLWVGDEKYLLGDNTTVEPYCSRAIFSPEGYLTWESVSNSTCRDAQVLPNKMETPKNWLSTIDLPGYIYRFRQKSCMGDVPDFCSEDITTDSDEGDTHQFQGGWRLEAKACGAHLKDDQLYVDTYTCESYQVSLISRSRLRGGVKDYRLVVTLYYHFHYGGWTGYTCKKPTFKATNIDEAYDGSTRFVLQSSYNMTNALNPCTWDCFDPDSTEDNPGGITCP